MDFQEALKKIAVLPSVDGKVSVPENLVRTITASRKKEADFDAMLDKVNITLPARLLRIFEPILRPKDEAAQMSVFHNWEKLSGLHIFKPENGSPMVLATNGHIVACYRHKDIHVSFPPGLNELRLRVPDGAIKACHEPAPFRLLAPTMGGITSEPIEGSIPAYAVPERVICLGRTCCIVSPAGGPPDEDQFPEGGVLFNSTYERRDVLQDDQYKMAPASGINWPMYLSGIDKDALDMKNRCESIELTNVTMPIVSDMLNEYAKHTIVKQIGVIFTPIHTDKNKYVIIKDSAPPNGEELWLQVSMARGENIKPTPVPAFISEFVAQSNVGTEGNGQ